jgi:hypothetical protein
MKDYSRKQYSDMNYRDFIGHKSAKSVWNQVLEQFPEQAEFAMKNSSTPLSRSIAAFIRQSEFKKPYKGLDFVNMEGQWEGPGRGVPYEPGGPDIITNLRNPVIFDFGDAGTTIFDAESDFKWCQAQPRVGIITGTHPITLLTVTFAHEGYSFTVISGIGTNSVSFELTAHAEQAGFITIEASMLSSSGVPGDSNVNVFGADDCCGGEEVDHLEPDPDSTPETIAPDDTVTIYVLNGTPPYFWSIVTGTGHCINQVDEFSLSDEETTDPNVNLTSTINASGGVNVSCVDSCEETVIQVVRCTDGEWVGQIDGCQTSGPADSHAGFPGSYIKMDGCIRQTVDMDPTAPSGTGGCSCSAPEQPKEVECLDWDCTMIDGDLVTCEFGICRGLSSPSFCRQFRTNNYYAEWGGL